MLAYVVTSLSPWTQDTWSHGSREGEGGRRRRRAGGAGHRRHGPRRTGVVGSVPFFTVSAQVCVSMGPRPGLCARGRRRTGRKGWEAHSPSESKSVKTTGGETLAACPHPRGMREHAQGRAQPRHPETPGLPAAPSAQRPQQASCSNGPGPRAALLHEGSGAT